MKKAEEFLLLADAAESTEWDAAISNAAIAGINASDVVITLESRLIGHAADHSAAVKTLRSLGYGIESNQLSRLLKIKNVAQYGERRCTSAEASDAVTRATRLVESARARLSKETSKT